jgi:diguanylate cyclase (GGDEF)-like protein/PAS domain S-box-containing protein
MPAPNAEPNRQTVLVIGPRPGSPDAVDIALARPGVTVLHAAAMAPALAAVRGHDVALVVVRAFPANVLPPDACRQLHREHAGRSLPILCLDAGDPAAMQSAETDIQAVAIETLPPAAGAVAIAGRIAAMLDADAALRQRRLLDAALEASRDHYESIMATVGDGILALSSDGVILSANAAAQAILGREEELVGRRFHLFYPLQGETDSVWQYTPFFHTWLTGAVQGVDDAFFRRASGSRFPVAFRCAPMANRRDGVVVVFQDLTTHRQLEARLRRQAVHDPLTGLSNRDGFKQALTEAVARAHATAKAVALLSIDLDRFTRINNTLGHDIGDAVLQAVARRLQECVGEYDLVARIGGDEFAIVMADIERPGPDAALGERVLAALRRPITMPDGLDIAVAASIGMASYPASGEEVDVLMRRAEVAMHQAKSDGRNQALLYAPEMNARASGRMAFEQALREAVDKRNFTLDYQPQVDLANGKVVGFEALLRWQREGVGIVSPRRFVPMLEETGLIVPVGQWVFESGCQQRQQWADRLPDECTVSINLSPRQFTDKRLAAQIRHILEVNELPAYRLEIELTESMLMLDREYTHGVLHALKEMGLRLSVDDFGTGYSSLAYLKMFALDALKIDKQFIDHLTDSTRDAAIATSIIQLGHNLGLQVVAEGV